MTDTCNWKRLVDASGCPVEIQHGWTVADTFDLGNDVYLIILASEQQGDAGWIVRDGSILVGGPTQIASNPDVRNALAESGIARRVVEFIDQPEIRNVYPNDLSRLLAKYENYYILIMSCIDILAETTIARVAAGERNIAYMADGNLLHIDSQNVLANPMWAGSDFKRTISLGDAHIPAAIVGAPLTVSRHIPLSISPEVPCRSISAEKGLIRLFVWRSIG